MNLKITNIQISSYAETQELPNLQYLADKLCEDNDMEYVLTSSKEHASLDKIDTTNVSSIFTKLKEYPYEFEINNSLQLASIDGVKIADNNNNGTVTLTQDQYNSILSRLSALENNSNSSTTNGNYSTEEQVVGTWIDGKPIYKKVYEGTTPNNATGVFISMEGILSNVDKMVKLEGFTNWNNGWQNRLTDYAGSTDYDRITYNSISNQLYIKVFNSTDNFSVPMYITFEYTKTTD